VTSPLKRGMRFPYPFGVIDGPEALAYKAKTDRGAHLTKSRIARVLYLLGALAAFVVAAGADRKFGF
jgi:hypothetical protein